MPLQVRQFEPGDTDKWDQFVQQHPYGSPFHLQAWRNSIEQTFGYEPYYLLAVQGETLRAVLPLFLVRNFIIGKALISSPFAVYGGILADSFAARLAIHEKLKNLARSLEIEYAELRNSHPDQCVGLPKISQYVTFSKATYADDQATLATIPKKTRNLIRKALKSPYSTRHQPKAFDTFETLYAKNMRRLGTPSFPRKHFAALVENFGDMVDVREIVLDGTVVAASFNFYFRDQMHVYYAASDYRYRNFSPNNYLYFDHLCWAGTNGYSTFDFGRCKRGTGTFNFKKHWGTKMRPLPYEVLLVKRKRIPNYTPTNPRFRLGIKMWQNLPLPVTRFVGPQVVRFFP